MPTNLVRTPRDERLWRRAKARAAEEGHAGDWPYVTAIYERMRGHEKKAADVLYHGSPVRLDVLEPKDGHGDSDLGAEVFASPEKAFAMAYLAKWGDRDINHGVENGRHYMREMRPGAFADTYGGRKGWLYEVPAGPFSPRNNHDPSYEVMSDKPVKPLRAKKIRDVLKALKKAGVDLHPYDPSAEGHKASIRRMINRVGTMSDSDRVSYLKWVGETNPELRRAIEAGLEKKAADVLYHGSPVKLDVLEPRNEHGDPEFDKLVFASPKKAFAMAYLADWGDRDIEQGWRNGKLLMREMRPGSFKDVYGGKSGWLHTVPAGSFKSLSDRNANYEVMSDEPVKALKTERIRNILRALRKAGVDLHPYDPSSKGHNEAVARMTERASRMSPEGRSGYLGWVGETNPELRDAIEAGLEKKAARVSVGPSGIHGEGLFVDEDVPKGAVLAKALSLRKGAPHRTKAGAKVNHSGGPNAVLERRGDSWYLKAARPLKTGDEVTVDYSEGPDFVKGPDPKWREKKAAEMIHYAPADAPVETEGLKPLGRFDPEARREALRKYLRFLAKGVKPTEENLREALRRQRGSDEGEDNVYGFPGPVDVERHERLKQWLRNRVPYKIDVDKLREAGLLVDSADLDAPPVDYDKIPEIGPVLAGQPHPMVRVKGGVIPPEYLSKQAASAKGIPDRSDKGDVSKLPVNKLLHYVLQRHKADRAGEHFDLRMGNGKMHSWAVPKAKMPKPGERLLAVRQPLHEEGYKDFQGVIPKGEYGAGKVATEDKGKVVVESTSPDKVTFVVAHRKQPQRYSLIRTKGDQWLLINTTPQTSGALEAHGPKVRYAKVPKEKAEKFLKGSHAVSAKIDGSAALLDIMKDRIEAVSYRPQKGTKKPIVHTYRMGLAGVKPPKELVGKKLRGEIYGVDSKGRPLPPQETGALLNATTANSLEKQRRDKTKLKMALFGILGEGNRFENFGDKLKELENIKNKLPKDVFTTPPTETDPKKARKLFEDIFAGRHPLTTEGVVATPLKGGGVPAKIKNLSKHDVYLTSVVPADSKTGPRRAGAVGYSLKPGGSEVGQIGTGFDRATAVKLLTLADKLKGARLKIRSQGQFGSGAHRAPALLPGESDLGSSKRV